MPKLVSITNIKRNILQVQFDNSFCEFILLYTIISTGAHDSFIDWFALEIRLLWHCLTESHTVFYVLI